MTSDDVQNFISGLVVGIIVGGLIVAICIGLDTKKFCPTCGAMYKDAVYCEHDGTLLKERGN